MYLLIAPHNIGMHWPVVAPWLAQAMNLEESLEPLNMLRERAERGLVQVWVGHEPTTQEIEVVFVTEGAMVDGVPTCLIRLLSGAGVHKWLPDLAYVECWAKSRGFVQVQIWGRKGWERLLKPQGYSHEATVLMRRLDQGVH